MKLTLIITGLGMGGAETQVCNLADQFYEQGHEVTIIYLTGEQVVSPTNDGIQIHSLSMSKNLFSVFMAVFRLIRILNAISPDIVHSHMVHANLLCRVARLFVKIPILISSAHNSNEGGKLRMLAYRFTDKLANITTNVGSESVNAFLKMKAAPKGRILSMPNGIDTERFRFNFNVKQSIRTQLNLLDNERFVLAVGRYDAQKDYQNMLNAISLLPSDASFRLFIVGNDVEQLAKQVEQLNLSDKIELLGLRKDVHELMAAADILLMSSAWEGLPIVIGEAMASECNIVTTDAGGCREWLTSNEQPVPIKSPTDLANALYRKLNLRDEELLDIGKHNRKYIVDNYSLKGVVNKWHHIYQGIY